jgi:cupin domain
MKVRRVVTGHNKSGKAIFVSDTQVEPITTALLHGSEFHRLWGSDRTSVFPDDGSPPAQPAYFPPVGGFRFGMFSLPPRSHVRPAIADRDGAFREVEEKLPGLVKHMEPNAPGMHTTATIDFEVVLEGEVWLELDDGKDVLLRTGDTVVQNGTRHAWRNKSDKIARLAVFIVGAEHKRVSIANS